MTEQKTFDELMAEQAQAMLDVKDKNGQPTGATIPFMEAIVKQVCNLALKGSLPHVAFVQNTVRRTDPKEQARREEEHREYVGEATDNLRRSLEADGLWIGQDYDVMRISEEQWQLEQMNRQISSPDFQYTIQDMSKDGTTKLSKNPLIDLRDKQQKQLQDDLQALRMDAQRRMMMRKTMKR